MEPTVSIREESVEPRRPSFPDWVYQAAQSVGLTDVSDQEMETFCALVQDIRSGKIPSRPSRLEEFAARVLYALGASEKSPQEMSAFIKYCHEGGDLLP